MTVYLDNTGEPIIPGKEFPPSELRFSRLKHMGRTPMHFKHACETPFEATPAMRFGTLVHAMVLGGEFVTWEHPNGRSGKGWKAFKEEHEGEFIVTSAEVLKALPVARAVQQHPAVRETGCLDGDREVELHWKRWGVDCGGRLDVVGRQSFGTFVTDLKTTVDAEPDRFQWQARKMSYHGQIEWYGAGAVLSGHLEQVDHHYLVAVESKGAHGVSVHRLTRENLDFAQRITRGWVESYRNCAESNSWPGYDECVVPFDVPEDDLGLVFGDEDDEAA